MAFADTHAHLSLAEQEVGAAALAGVLGRYAEAWALSAASGEPGALIVDAGTEPDDLAARSRLAAGRPFVRLAAGVWPGALALSEPRRALAELEASLSRFVASGGRCAAIGECGLDYHHMEGPREAQLTLFEAQVELAAARGRTLIVHSRDAFDDTLAVLAAARLGSPVVIHCFGYGPAEARAFLDLGCSLSFAGNLTYRKADALREACALVPEDRLLLETDSPYMNPEPARGRPSTPEDVGRSYAAAAALRGVGVPDLARTVAANAAALFA